MNVLFQQVDTPSRSYHGIHVHEQECRTHLCEAVKDNLQDREEWQDTLDRLRALEEETGFDANEGLLADIQALQNEAVEVQQFRIGEAYAEVILEQEFSCRFHWNENRDARNPKGNKTGADLVGFIQRNDDVLFLFGEVKTSSETANRPPQVMTGAYGIESQLRDLYDDRLKRSILIAYLKNKMRHFPDGHPFKTDFEASQKSYYSGIENFHLIGVLIRDVEQDERDVSLSYGRLKNHILEPQGISLLALYVPLPKEQWLDVINERI